MNKLKKKLLGTVGLLAVVAMTVFAITLPAFTVNAATDILVSVEVEGRDFSIGITSPVDGTSVVNATNAIANTAVVAFANANINSIYLTVSGPGGQQSAPFPGASSGTTGSVGISYTLEQGYGDYTLTPHGLDLDGNPQVGTPIAVHYHSANSTVTNPGTEDGGTTTDPVVKLQYGPEVCRVSFQVYAVDPMATPQYDLSKPLLAPPYAVDLTSGTSTTDITIPISKSPYNLKGGLYKIITETFDCEDGDPIEEDLDTDGGYEGGFYYSNPEGDVPPPVVPGPPDTGVIRIGGLMIAKNDLVATGIITLAALAVVYIAMRTRRHSIAYRIRR